MALARLINSLSPASRPRAPRVLLGCVLAAATLAGGCSNMMWYPGGPLASRDKYTFESTAWYPQTVSLVDTRTDQVVWTTDVPVDQQLVMRFDEGDGDANRITPDKMFYDTWPKGKRTGTPRRSFNVPPADARRIDVLQRPVPELPPDMKPAEAPTPRLPFPARN